MATLETLEEIVQHHEARLNLLAGIADRQVELLEECGGIHSRLNAYG